MPSKSTTNLSFHHKHYYTLSLSIYAFKTYHNLEFSSQTLLHTCGKYLCLQNLPQSWVFITNLNTFVSIDSKPSKPTTIFCFHHKHYCTLSVSIYAFKTYHNLEFSSQTLLHTFGKYLCLQNLPQSWIFITNLNTFVSYDSKPSKPTTIFCFHHKHYCTLSVSIYAFKTYHNLEFSSQTLLHTFGKYLCLQNLPQSWVFITNLNTFVSIDSKPSKPTTIFCFHHKHYCTLSVSIYAFKTYHSLGFASQSLLNTFGKYLCLQNLGPTIVAAILER